jgi:putative glutamine amidotransferase
MAGAAPLRIGIVDKCAPDGMVAGENYIAFVRAAGAEPVLLRVTEDKAEIERMLDGCDMLLFAGGEDVDPSRFGEKLLPGRENVNAQRDAWEFAVLDAAVPRRKPLFGICRGCQLLNVYFGGTLWQDLPTEFDGCRPEGHYLKDGGEHEAFFEPGSQIAKRLGLLSTTVNSTHHQAVKAPGRGFRFTAHSPDGVVEAIENVDYPAAAVQFHPERLVVQKGRPEFSALVAALPDSSASRCETIKAGLYCGLGSRGGYNVYWGKILEDSPDVELTYLDGEDLRSGKLDGLDILVMPGGSGFDQYDSMQEEGAEAVRRFIRNGGKYFGTCAGLAVLLNERKRIALLPFKRIDGHYLRGGGVLEVEFNAKWMQELALPNANWQISFHDGPVIVPETAVPDVKAETMAICKNAVDQTEGKTASERDSMIGTPAFVYATCGKGEIIACSCHPEGKAATRVLIAAAFGRLLGRRIAIPSFGNHPKGYKYKADGTKETLQNAVAMLK